MMQTVGIHLKRDATKGIINNEMLDWEFKLDGILHNASQELMFSTVASDMVKATLEGFNGKFSPLLRYHLINLIKWPVVFLCDY